MAKEEFGSANNRATYISSWNLYEKRRWFSCCVSLADPVICEDVETTSVMIMGQNLGVPILLWLMIFEPKWERRGEKNKKKWIPVTNYIWKCYMCLWVIRIIVKIVCPDCHGLSQGIATLHRSLLLCFAQTNCNPNLKSWYSVSTITMG